MKYILTFLPLLFILTSCSLSEADRKASDFCSHNYIMEKVEPTCTENGYDYYFCLNCGDQKYENVISKKGHSIKTQKIPATCIDSAYYLRYCENCSLSEKTETGKKLGHNFIMTTVLPSETNKGYEEYHCDRCDYSYKTNFKDTLDHSYILITTNPATCSKPGSNIYQCQNCQSYKVEQTSSKLEHNYINDICSLCGERR